MGTTRRTFLKRGTLAALATGVSVDLTRNVIAGERRCDLAPALNKADFEAHLNSTFVVHAGREKSVELTLTSITDLKRPSDRRGRQGFSLLFRGPVKTTLVQDTYLIEHNELGTFKLLMVPSVTRKNEPHYEIIINRLYP